MLCNGHPCFMEDVLDGTMSNRRSILLSNKQVKVGSDSFLVSSQYFQLTRRDVNKSVFTTFAMINELLKNDINTNMPSLLKDYC
jgi:hypothetical protein